MRFVPASGGLAVLLLAGIGVMGCGGSSVASGRDATTDGRPVDHTADRHTDDGASDLVISHPDGATPLPAACGGTVQASGTTPSGSFSAQYVYLSLALCADELLIAVAPSDSYDSDMIEIRVLPDPQTDSHVGTSTVTATYVAAGTGAQESVPVQVTITAFPPTVVPDQDGGLDPVTGSFSIDSSGFSISGTFSSSLCAVDSCG